MPNQVPEEDDVPGIQSIKDRSKGTLVRGLGVAVLMLFFGAPGPEAQDWPQWRGPARDGHAPTFQVPETWPESLSREWRREVGSGYSSPVVADGRVCLHAREGDDEKVFCLGLEDGEVLWLDTYSAPYSKNSYALDHGKGPNATPVLAEGRLHTLGMSGILSTYDVARGELLWRFDASERVSSEKLFCGTSASPLLVDGLLVVQLGDDVGGGGVFAFDPATGDQRWLWDGAGPGYASPIVAEIGGVRQVVTLTQRSIVGLDLSSGALLWEIDFDDEWNENIVTPLVVGDMLIVAGVRRGTWARKVAQVEGRWTVGEAWTQADLPQYMSSPVLAEGTLYGLSSRRKGQLFALDVASGEIHWQGEGRRGRNAAVVASGGEHLAVLTTEGALVFLDRSTEALRTVARYEVAEGGTWAHPALLDDRVVVRDAEALTVWRLAAATDGDEGAAAEEGGEPTAGGDR